MRMSRSPHSRTVLVERHADFEPQLLQETSNTRHDFHQQVLHNKLLPAIGDRVNKVKRCRLSIDEAHGEEQLSVHGRDQSMESLRRLGVGLEQNQAVCFQRCIRMNGEVVSPLKKLHDGLLRFDCWRVTVGTGIEGPGSSLARHTAVESHTGSLSRARRSLLVDSGPLVAPVGAIAAVSARLSRGVVALTVIAFLALFPPRGSPLTIGNRARRQVVGRVVVDLDGLVVLLVTSHDVFFAKVFRIALGTVVLGGRYREVSRCRVGCSWSLREVQLQVTSAVAGLVAG